MLFGRLGNYRSRPLSGSVALRKCQIFSEHTGSEVSEALTREMAGRDDRRSEAIAVVKLTRVILPLKVIC